jgi:hypothetical protein
LALILLSNYGFKNLENIWINLHYPSENLYFYL